MSSLCNTFSFSSNSTELRTQRFSNSTSYMYTISVHTWAEVECVCIQASAIATTTKTRLTTTKGSLLSLDFQQTGYQPRMGANFPSDQPNRSRELGSTAPLRANPSHS